MAMGFLKIIILLTVSNLYSNYKYMPFLNNWINEIIYLYFICAHALFFVFLSLPYNSYSK